MAPRLHGMGDVKRYNARMSAVEYTIKHEDGESLRVLETADVTLLAPSRCGKTPTTVYLALQQGSSSRTTRWYPKISSQQRSRSRSAR